MNGVTRKIIFLNIFIFFLWHLLDFGFMSRYFLVSTHNVLSGHYWTILSSVFSHHLFFHLFLNMLILANFGAVLERLVGKFHFLSLYLLSGISGSLIHCLTSTFLIKNDDLNALGASGAISGLLIFYSLNFPKKLLYLFGFIPVPALLASLIFISLDLYGLFNQASGHGLPIGHGAHLGGALWGGVYYVYLKFFD